MSTHSLPRRTSFLVLFCGALLLFWNLGYAPFWNPDEGRYASSSLEMMGGVRGQAPDWVVPHLNTIPRLNKPPLVYWAAATFYSIFGPSEWSGRLGSAIAALGVMFLVWQIGRKTWNERVGLFAAIIWVTALFSFGMARVLNTDMLLCGTTTLSLYGLWRAIEYSQRDENSSRVDWMAFLIAGLGMGLALLAKGPVGVAMPLLVAFFYLLAARRWRVLRNTKIWLGVLLASLLAIAIASPWYLAVNARDSRFLMQFLLGENLQRFAGGKNFHDATPFYYYVPVLVLGLLPWTPLLVPAFMRLPRDLERPQDRTLLFAWVWAGFIVVFFSLSSTKLISYVLPAFPALAIILAVALSRVLDSQRWSPVFTYTMLGINGLLLLAVYVLVFSGRLIPAAEGISYLTAVSVVLLGGTGWILLNARQGTGDKTVFAQFGTFVLFYVVLLSLIGRVAPYEDSSAMVKYLAPKLGEEAKFRQFYFQPTSVFYLRRPITIIGFKNTSGLQGEALRRSPYFPSPNEASGANQKLQEAAEKKWHLDVLRTLPQVLRARNPEYALVRTKDYSLLPKELQASAERATYIIARNSDVLLISNRPAPPDFRFEHVSPHKVDKEKLRP